MELIGMFSSTWQQKPVRCLAIAILCTIGCGFSAVSAQSPPTTPPRLITQKIDESRKVALPGSVPPGANAQNDRGSLADNFPLEHIQFLLKRSSEQEAQLKQFMDEQLDPNSPNYHHWLTAEEFGQRYGLAQEDVNTIVSWLTAKGFTINAVRPGRSLIDFSGTAGLVRKNLGIEMHKLLVNGVSHIANMANPQIPEALLPAIVGIVSLNDFWPQAHSRILAQPGYNLGNGVHELVPEDMAVIYNLNPLFQSGYSGVGQTIAVVEDSDVYNVNDWYTFRSNFGLSQYTNGSINTVHPGGCGDPSVGGDDLEAIIDAEWSTAFAPSAAIEIASCSNGVTSGVKLAIDGLVNSIPALRPTIISVSYGYCEAYQGPVGNASYASSYQQAATEGISVFVITGDAGAGGCNYSNGTVPAPFGLQVNGLATTPYNVAVGGTDFYDTFLGTTSSYWSSTNGAFYGSALSYIPEIPWNSSCGSVLLAQHQGLPGTYGSTGWCNNFPPPGNGGPPDSLAGSGGASACATGSPSTSTPNVVSGSCAGTPKPDWQAGIFTNVAVDNVRNVPDVSLFAADGAALHASVVCLSDNLGHSCTSAPGTWLTAGGTSLSAPMMAGIQALVNQKAGISQGNVAPVYYQLARQEYGTTGNTSCYSNLGSGISSSCVFNDITSGDIDVPCAAGTPNCYVPSGAYGVLSTSITSYSPAYAAGPGWDFATGLGSVNAYNLVNQWPQTLTDDDEIFEILMVVLQNKGLTH
jgi:subtilase family serine protease